jgi:hypothetical protein
LPEDKDIYLERKPNFVDGMAAALNDVEAVVEYQFGNVT